MTLRDIYDEHFQFVWRSLRRLGVREADLPDAVQDVFLVVHRRLGDFRGDSKLTTWLYGICFRVASDRRRLAHVRREVVSDTLDSLTPEGPDTVDAIALRQARDVLDTILDQMSLEQRAVFTLFELDGLRSEAIAELLEIPLGTVYSRLRLARQVFRRAVERRRTHERFNEAQHGGRIA